ncbi:MAG TPA: hypothetical protein ENK82_03715, partial [Campylobacterales bacterium]|nr:hypothetical protein [Campylobacterales bacterium]
MITFKHILPLTLTLTTSLFTGCVTTSSPEGDFSNRVNLAGANQLFSKNFESFDNEKLLYLLDPLQEGRAVKQNLTEIKSLHKPHQEKMTDEQKLRMAFYNANNTSLYSRAHRSQIQDRLIAASNQRCNLYKVYLKRVSTEQNSIFGTLTTILAGAGSIVTNTSTARTLSGLASIASGTRAELNHAIFESVTTSIIIPGIDSRRKTLHDRIMKQREKSLTDYTVEAAIADVIKYNGACSIDSGISNAQKRIQSYDIEKKTIKAITNQTNPIVDNGASVSLGQIAMEANSEKSVKELEKLLEDNKQKVQNSRHENLRNLYLT